MDAIETENPARVAQLTEADWAVLSPLLDEALALNAADRTIWVAELAARQPKLAAAIESLLAEQMLVEAQHFLADDPLRPPGGRAGEVIGDYTLLAPLGEGGMGSVWLARRSDGRFEANVALKLLSPAVLGDAGGARFRREGRLLAQLTHANIAHLIDAGVTHGGQPYLVLEYVDGEQIDAYCDGAKLDVDARVRLFLDVLAAVAEAHRKLIVHRDIKPSNVVVRRDGVVKLIDFGIAKLIGETEPGEEPLTRDGRQAFTPEYAAPEQIRGDEVTTVTDVYSLGVLLFELLVGERPFSRAEKESFASRSTDIVPPLASSRLASKHMSFRRRLEGDLDNILGKALRSDARERYSSVGAFADDLHRFLANEPVTAHVDTLTYRAGKFVRRHRGAVAAGVLTALALVTATVITTLQSIEAERQRDRAQHQLQIAQASNDFVTSLLSQDAADARGLTPVELLDRGMDAIRLRYADDPTFSISILLLLSGRYMDIGRTDKEYAALLEAESIARKTHNPHALLDVLCNTVETEIAAGRRDRALDRMTEARALLTTTNVEPVIEANCLRQEAILARQDLGATIEYLERAKAVLERGGETYSNVYGAIFSWLYSFNHAAGRNLAAHRYHLEELANVAKYHREHTVQGRMAPVELAYSWEMQGEVRRAVDLFENAFRDSDVLDLNPVVGLRYGRALSLLGRHDEALSRLDAGIALARSSGQMAYARGGELDRARALLRAGRPSEAQTTLDAVLPDLQAAAMTEQISLGDECQAEIDFANGRLDAAEAAASESLALLGYPHSAFGSWPALALTLRARIRTSAGQPAAAIDDARAAVELLEADVVDPRQSATVGAARLALAEGELAAGQSRAAVADAQRAAESLRNGLGAGHPSTQVAELLTERLSGSGT
jgi:tetratricopeptide (TPR) repeat protein